MSKKITFHLHKRQDILEASLASLTIQSQDRRIKISVSKGSKGYILLAKSKNTRNPNHLAVVFENDFVISDDTEIQKKTFLVLHAWFTKQKKVRVLVEFFGNFKEIEDQLLPNSENYSYIYSDAGVSYVGFDAVPELLSKIEDKDFNFLAPFKMTVEEAKNDTSFVNCKRFAMMLCSSFKLEIKEEIIQKFLDMSCFKTVENIRLIEKNGWTNNKLLWEYS